MPNFLDLPPELAIRIFLSLSLSDLAACQLTSSFLYSVIANSAEVQYYLATLIAGVDNNVDIDLSVLDRLERLRSLEQGWRHIKFDFSHTVRSGAFLGGGSSFSPTLADGFHFMGRVVNPPGRKEELLYFKFPLGPDEEVHQKSLCVAEHGIIDIAVAVYEHDLIAVASP